MIAAPERFREEELELPRRLFEREGARVTVASSRSGRLAGMDGGRATATAVIDALHPSDWDAVLVVGGDGAQEYLWGHRALLALLRQAAEAEQLIGAICLGSVVLARAGLVGGREIAVWRSPASLDELDRAGVRCAEQDVISAGRIVTASGPHAAEEWAGAVTAALCACASRRPATTPR